jgi:hypothetical protein
VGLTDHAGDHDGPYSDGRVTQEFPHLSLPAFALFTYSLVCRG